MLFSHFFLRNLNFPTFCRKFLIYAFFSKKNNIFALFCHPESFCAQKAALRKVFDFSASGQNARMLECQNARIVECQNARMLQNIVSTALKRLKSFWAKFIARTFVHGTLSSTEYYPAQMVEKAKLQLILGPSSS